ncbi:hypothetical protein [Bizionia algoritergicola]|uniref:DUF1837 domain-containing protein n=2 Tax=Bizionia TaxID=283785 RepID=A0A5D0QS43_9FLAO|nr:hypothetical protein [Bizionia algoritergicola]TYB71972.1 hypothetical protein ES675_12455 [Bizionia algoritergicola]
MIGYKILDQIKIKKHISFIRIEPTDIKLTLSEIFKSLSNLAWISQFDQDYVKAGFQTRAEDTVKYISENIISKNDDEITKDTGELVVSELSRLTIVNELKYLDIPLAELIKIKDIGNHGFDFYTKNKENVLLFGEAKYNSSQNAYGRSFEQIARFEREKRDASDIIDIDRFCCEPSKENHAKGLKGFVASFSCKSTTTEKIINSIKKNTDFITLDRFEELVLVAVNL